jgi:hypothetical protein
MMHIGLSYGVALIEERHTFSRPWYAPATAPTRPRTWRTSLSRD